MPISLGMSPVSPGVDGRNSCDARRGVGEVHMPQRRAAPVVGVERIDAVVLCRDDDDVVDALSGDVHVLHVERRGERQAVQWIAEQLPERRLIDVRRRQNRLVEILARPHVVVVIGEGARVVTHVDGCIGSLSPGGCRDGMPADGAWRRVEAAGRDRPNGGVAAGHAVDRPRCRPAARALPR